MEEKTQEELIMQIVDAAMALGWQLAFENNDDEDVRGLIVGTEDYISDILKSENERQ